MLFSIWEGGCGGFWGHDKFALQYFTEKSAAIVKEESEAGEFVKAINALTAYGGGDCPEYTFRGMLETFRFGPEWGSPMYVFTDADPKDASDENIQELQYLADDFGVTINFLTTGKGI